MAGVLDTLRDVIWGEKPKSFDAPNVFGYPTEEETSFARQSGIDYGSPNAQFIIGGRARVAPRMRGSINEEFANTLNKIATTDVPLEHKSQMADIYTAAQLISNRSPITALGFDPRKIAIDMSGEKLTLGGVYLPKEDQVWAGISDKDAIVHEATHRGLNKLKNSDLLTDDEKKWLGAGNNEEYLVRHLMQKYAGVKAPPMGTKPANIGEEQESNAAFRYGSGDIGGSQKNRVNVLEAKAQQLFTRLYSKGPH